VDKRHKMNEQTRNYTINQYLDEFRARVKKEPACSICGHGLKYHNENRQCPDYTGPGVKWMKTKFTVKE
jgi:hypothetical protein